jgi:hypothetical protein
MTDKTIFVGLAIVGIALVVVASGRNDGSAAPASPGVVDPAGALPEGHPPIQAPAAAEPGPSGTVLEAMDGGGYTYVRLETTGGEFWVAGPPTELEVGETVSLSGAMEMGAFSSKALGRDFERLVFTNAYLRVR